jgi:hypothetical protein
MNFNDPSFVGSYFNLPNSKIMDNHNLDGSRIIKVVAIQKYWAQVYYPFKPELKANTSEYLGDNPWIFCQDENRQVHRVAWLWINNWDSLKINNYEFRKPNSRLNLIEV